MNKFSNMDQLPMKKKLNRLEGIISNQGEFKARLGPDGRVMKEGLAEDEIFAGERNYIMSTLRKE